ncbi:MAG: hypothetical protein ACRCXZ_01220 [Patescibacteria group bacterium]
MLLLAMNTDMLTYQQPVPLVATVKTSNYRDYNTGKSLNFSSDFERWLVEDTTPIEPEVYLNKTNGQKALFWIMYTVTMFALLILLLILLFFVFAFIGFILSLFGIS